MKGDKQMSNELKFKHPRIALKIMHNFINSAMDEEVMFLADEGIEVDWDTFTTKKVREEKWEYPEVILKKEKQFCAYDNREDDSIIKIGYNFSYYYERSPFYVNFIQRYKPARGFAKITLTLLHELGHIETFSQLPYDYDRAKTICEIKQKAREENLNIWEANMKYYFPLYEETLATEWAIKWLQNSENRKIAKKFEKEFFACVKK